MASLLAIYANEAITLVAEPTKDKWGTPTADGVEVSTKARVIWKTRLVRDNAGELVESQGYADMETMPEHVETLKVSGIEYNVLSVQEHQDWSDQFYRVYFR